jgi:hypothetical protein
LFTWSNKQEGDDLVLVCLDRAVANCAFSAIFDDCVVENIITTTSDHLAILIHLQNHEDSSDQRHVQSGFKFEAVWLRAPDYKETLNGPKSLTLLGPT